MNCKTNLTSTFLFCVSLHSLHIRLLCTTKIFSNKNTCFSNTLEFLLESYFYMIGLLYDFITGWYTKKTSFGFLVAHQNLRNSFCFLKFCRNFPFAFFFARKTEKLTEKSIEKHDAKDDRKSCWKSNENICVCISSFHFLLFLLFKFKEWSNCICLLNSSVFYVSYSKDWLLRISCECILFSKERKPFRSGSWCL